MRVKYILKVNDIHIVLWIEASEDLFINFASLRLWSVGVVTGEFLFCRWEFAGAKWYGTVYNTGQSCLASWLHNYVYK